VWLELGTYTDLFFRIDLASPSATGDEFGGPQGSQGLAPAVVSVRNPFLYR
jgi:hypothetical protein